MNKHSTILILILIFVSCQKKDESIDIANELKGNTFNIISSTEKDTSIIDFKDSTYIAFGGGVKNSGEWKIATFDDTAFLVFDWRVTPIKRIDENSFIGLYIATKDYEIVFEKRKTEWNRDQLNGIWIEEKHYEHYLLDLNSNDSLPKGPPPPPPPIGATESDFQYPPFYEIQGDTISANYYYAVSKSNIYVSNSTEFIMMKLMRSDLKRVEELWKIKKLNDSIMIIDRTIEKDNLSSVKTIEENIKLIKKR